MKILLNSNKMFITSTPISPINIYKNNEYKQLLNDILFFNLNGKYINHDSLIYNDSILTSYTINDVIGKIGIHNSCGYILGEAITNIFKKSKLINLPLTNNNTFYYDFFLKDKKDIKNYINVIEKEFSSIINKNNVIITCNNKKKALEIFYKNTYKINWINKNIIKNVYIWKNKNFYDIFKGNKLINLNIIKKIKIIKIVKIISKYNIYSNNIYRIFAYPIIKINNNNVSLYLKNKKTYDHRKIGKKLKLFIFSKISGKGLPIWLPNGNYIKSSIINYLYNILISENYKFVTTPHISNESLYKKSKHLKKFKDKIMSFCKEKNNYLIKPMNCPYHCEIFRNICISYKCLPFRIAEFGTVYRYENTGELLGLLRTRCFTQDDAHIFCSELQIKNEIKKIITQIFEILIKFSIFKYNICISLRDKNKKYKYCGTDEIWNKSEEIIFNVLLDLNLLNKCKIIRGEAAFYGPKIDFLIKDKLNRIWQLSTIQIDYNLPIKLNLNYKNKLNKSVRPIIIHRALTGSIERFIGILLEHTYNILPFWLSPKQIVIIPISNKYNEYCKHIFYFIKKKIPYINIKIDNSNNKIEKKIKYTEIYKIHITIIIGKYEEKYNLVSLRVINYGKLGYINLNDLIKFILYRYKYC